MRIRSIKPEFWRSKDIVNLSWDARLVFIGLWSYVDDNGVGWDDLPSIVGDLFVDDLSVDPTETLRRVSLALEAIEKRGLIVRYEAGRKHLFQITGWEKHQLVKNPSKGHKYPEYSGSKASAPNPLLPLYGDPTETLPTGTGEQGNRGTGEQKDKPRSAGDYSPAFEEFWKNYPRHRRREKPNAYREWQKAIKRAAPETIISGLRVFCSGDVAFAPYPAKWLKNDSWNDGVNEAAQSSPPRSSFQPDVLDELGRMDELAGNGPAVDAGQFAGAPRSIGR